MSSLRVGLVACANGFGHVRRMLALARALEVLGASAVLLAPQQAVRSIASASRIALPQYIDFESRTTRGDWLMPEGRCWTDALPALDSFDIVVSDNLIEILAVRPQAWLSGSFFWHLALPGFPQAKAERAEALLADCRPRMISTDLFAASYLAAKTRLHRVGLYAFGSAERNESQTDVLVSCGRGGEVMSATQALLSSIASAARPAYVTVWVEPELYRPEMPAWMQPANFSPEMYGRLAAAVIRPGVGTVTDALLAGARLFTFHETDNLEMLGNARRLASANLAEACDGPMRAWLGAVDYARSRVAQGQHAIALQALSHEGAQQAARLILAGGTC